MSIDKQNEIITYYNTFYLNNDFSYYSEKISMKFVKTIIKKSNLKKGDKILDVGCGTGFYVDIFTRLGFDALGIDISKTAIEKARLKYPNSEFEIADATNLNFSNNKFHLIFLYGCSVINNINIDDTNRYIEYLMNYVCMGGSLVYIGGSDFSGRLSKNSEWYNHQWSEIDKIMVKKREISKNAYLTHMRFIYYFGGFGFSKLLNIILRIPFLKIKRMVLIFFQY